LKESNGEEKSVLRNTNQQQRKKTKDKSVLRNTNQQQRKKTTHLHITAVFQWKRDHKLADRRRAIFIAM